MDIIKWIKKNNFKDIDDELSNHIDKLRVIQSDKEKLINKIKSYKTTLRSLKESLDVVNGEISKSNIVSLGSTLPKLLQIDGKSYEMKGKQKIGVLAQDIQEVFPEIVSEDDNEMLAVNYQGLVPVLINALKEQDIIIKSQEERLTNIENLIANLND